MNDSRIAMIESLISAAEGGVEVMVMVSDSTSTSKIKPFMERFPERVVDVGIAEQNLIGMAAGMSLGGYVTVTANAAPFLVNRSAEQVRNDVAYSDTNVKMMGLNPGFAYGALGATHHSLEDVSMMRSLGGMRIYTPVDPRGTADVVTHVLKTNGPAYVRVDSGQFADFPRSGRENSVERPLPLSEGDDVTILAMGTSSHQALEAADLLRNQGIKADTWAIPSIRPLEKEAIIESMKRTGTVVTVEAHSVHGGLGSLISEWIAEEGLAVRLKRLGVPEGSFAPASPRKAIEETLNLHPEGIARTASATLKASTL